MNKANPQPPPEGEAMEILRPPFARSAESEKLANYLSELPVGALVSYEKIRELIDEEPQRGSGYALVLGVRKRLLRDERAVWFARAAVGLQRANEQEKIELAQSGNVSIRRKNQKNQRYLTSVDFHNLTDEQKQEFYFMSSVAGTLQLFYSRSAQKKLVEKVQTTQTEADPKVVLRLFAGQK